MIDLNYNKEWTFIKDLINIKLDDDIKNGILLAYGDLISNQDNNIEIDNITIKGKGGLNYNKPLKKGYEIEYFNKAYHYDIVSCNATIYTKLLTFFSDKTKQELSKKIKQKQKANPDTQLKIKQELVEISGNLIYRNKGKYYYSTSLIAKALILQFIRDNNIKYQDIISIKTDGIICSKDIKDIKIHKNIKIKKTIYKYLHHYNNNKYITFIDKKGIVKGDYKDRQKYDTLQIIDLTRKIYQDQELSGLATFTLSTADKTTKCYEILDIDILNNIALDGIICTNQKELTKLIDNNKIKETNDTKTTNADEIYNKIKKQINNYFKLVTYVNDDQARHNKISQNRDINNFYNKYFDIFLFKKMLGKIVIKDDINILSKCTKYNNTILSLQHKNIETLAIIPSNKYVIIDIDDAEHSLIPSYLSLDKSKTLTVQSIRSNINNKKISYKLIFKVPKLKENEYIIYKKIKGIEYIKDKKQANILGYGDTEKHIYKLIDNDILDLPKPLYEIKTVKKEAKKEAIIMQINNENTNKLNDKLKENNINLYFKQGQNNNKIEILNSQCINKHKGGNDKSIALLLTGNTPNINCNANDCNINNNNDDIRKKILKIVDDIFYSNDASTSNRIEFDDPKELTSKYIDELEKARPKPLYSIGNHNIKKDIVSLFVGGGGVGKGLFELAFMLQLILINVNPKKYENMFLKNVKVNGKIKVGFMSFEDDEVVILVDRLKPFVLGYKIDNIDFNQALKNLYVIYDSKGINADTVLFKNLENYINKYKINYLVIDTLSRISTNDTETLNKEATDFIIGIERIAHSTNCHIRIIHHSSKAGITSGDMSTATRGSSAIQDTVRLAYNLSNYYTPKGGYSNHFANEKIKKAYRNTQILASGNPIIKLLKLSTVKVNYTQGYDTFIALTYKDILNKKNHLDKHLILEQVTDEQIKTLNNEMKNDDDVKTNNKGNNNQDKKAKMIPIDKNSEAYKQQPLSFKKKVDKDIQQLIGR